MLSQRDFWTGKHGFLAPRDWSALAALGNCPVCVGDGPGPAFVTDTERRCLGLQCGSQAGYMPFAHSFL